MNLEDDFCGPWVAYVSVQRVLSKNCSSVAYGVPPLGSIDLDYYAPSNRYARHFAEPSSRFLAIVCCCRSVSQETRDSICLINESGECFQKDEIRVDEHHCMTCQCRGVKPLQHTHVPVFGHSYDIVEKSRVYSWSTDEAHSVCRRLGAEGLEDDVFQLAKVMLNLRPVYGSYGSRSLGLVTTEAEILRGCKELTGSVLSHIVNVAKHNKEMECQRLATEFSQLPMARSKYREAKQVVSERLRGRSPATASATPRISAS